MKSLLISAALFLVISPLNAEVKAAAHKVTFIELGSTKCIPCKKMAKVIEEVKKECGTQVKFVFHDVWTSEGKPFAKKYKVRIIPTQVFLDDKGEEFFRHEGFYPKKKIMELLRKNGVK